jgi:ATP-dependent Clp protease ATP-binding subunit ClpA
VTLEGVRDEVRRIVGEGDEVTSGQIPFTPRGKKVLELSLREAKSLGHKYIGTEHVLLGIVREKEGVAAQILLHFGWDAEKIRGEVIRMLSGPGHGPRDGPRVASTAMPFAAQSPPLSPEVAGEIERVRGEKEGALERQEYERAAVLRDRERRLVDAANRLIQVWNDQRGLP